HVRHAAEAPAAYEPGQFFRRELPHVLAALAELPALPGVIVIDAHVWLGPGREGMGAHLYAALDGRCAVVGIAKRPFRGAVEAAPVLRGASANPLYVSAAGMAPAVAASHVERMHGPYRLPTLVKRADRLARDAQVVRPWSY
ncbi:MAG: endonuclease V, partial [Phycisphaerales bacterium]|nr:endonuclease V [Phycisphaerales bacterium]